LDPPDVATRLGKARQDEDDVLTEAFQTHLDNTNLTLPDIFTMDNKTARFAAQGVASFRKLLPQPLQAPHAAASQPARNNLLQPEPADWLHLHSTLDDNHMAASSLMQLNRLEKACFAARCGRVPQLDNAEPESDKSMLSDSDAPPQFLEVDDLPPPPVMLKDSLAEPHMHSDADLPSISDIADRFTLNKKQRHFLTVAATCFLREHENMKASGSIMNVPVPQHLVQLPNPQSV
jgi:hypothetical protein